MAADCWEVADEVAELAAAIVVDLRDEDPERLHARLRALRRRDPLRVEQLVVALAAMVPDDVPVSELLGWTDRLMPETRRRQLAKVEYDARRYRERRLQVVPSTGDGQDEEESA